MTGALLFALALVSTAPPPRVLVLDVKTSSMDAAAVTTFTKLITHELAIALAPMSVVDVHEVARLADLEADRQDAGCTTTSCLAEVAGAYGAELVVFGEEARLTTPTNPDSGPLGFGLFGAGASMLLVGAPLIAGGTLLFCTPSPADSPQQAATQP